jgi:predicted CoA-binding protein
MSGLSEGNILRRYHTIAVVGLRDDPARYAYTISKYMQEAGYRIIPVEPGQTEVLGEKAYPDLVSVPAPVDIVNIFKRPEQVAPWVDESIAIGAKVVWMQEGIWDDAAAEKARAAGLEVVMDRCIRSAHRRMSAELQ